MKTPPLMVAALLSLGVAHAQHLAASDDLRAAFRCLPIPVADELADSAPTLVSVGIPDRTPIFLEQGGSGGLGCATLVYAKSETLLPEDLIEAAPSWSVDPSVDFERTAVVTPVSEEAAEAEREKSAVPEVSVLAMSLVAATALLRRRRGA